MQFIQRKVYFELKDHLDKPEISLVLGPRQSGKTTLMLKLKQELETDNQATIYFNLDILEDRQYFTTQHTLLEKIEKTIGKVNGVVFLDEIQRLTNAGLFLKGLYDLRSGYKFIVSGSGSLELKENIIEPMTGRKKIFYCLPLSFQEFSAYKLGTSFEKVTDLLFLDALGRERMINEYLFYGGYPRVVLAKTDTEKKETLNEIFRSYLEKDIQLLLKVEKEAIFSGLIKILSRQTGNLINRAELANTLGVSEKTIEKYLYFLEKTFVIALVKPFYTNARKELTKSPKIYFLDLGFLTLASGEVWRMDLPISGGRFENACFLRLCELNLFEPIHFWRSSSGAEVDFIVSSIKGDRDIPVEVKYSPGKVGTLGKSLISFILKYKAKRAYIYSKQSEGEVEKFGAKVKYLPYYLSLDN